MVVVGGSVLYLSNNCLPYNLQKERTLTIVRAQQTYATRLIAVAYRRHHYAVRPPASWVSPYGTGMG